MALNRASLAWLRGVQEQAHVTGHAPAGVPAKLLEVQLPAYDPAKLTAGIAHFSVSSFHRSHQVEISFLKIKMTILQFVGHVPERPLRLVPANARPGRVPELGRRGHRRH